VASRRQPHRLSSASFQRTIVARIVVIGGGFGGASCARAFRKIDPKLESR